MIQPLRNLSDFSASSVIKPIFITSEPSSSSLSLSSTEKVDPFFVFVWTLICPVHTLYTRIFAHVYLEDYFLRVLLCFLMIDILLFCIYIYHKDFKMVKNDEKCFLVYL